MDDQQQVSSCELEQRVSPSTKTIFRELSRFRAFLRRLSDSDAQYGIVLQSCSGFVTQFVPLCFVGRVVLRHSIVRHVSIVVLKAHDLCRLTWRVSLS
eukprot:6165733-Amphidinium_carterae.1